MKAALLVLLGLLCGALAHTGWYAWRRPAPVSADPVAWMRNELHLTDTQLAQIRTLHERSAPQLRELARRTEQMRAELESFEATRRRDGRVDFLAFARFVEDWRRVDQLCADTTRQLIAATAEQLDPEQRARYFARVHPSTPARFVN